MARPRLLTHPLSAGRRAAIGAGLRSLRAHILLWIILPVIVFLLGLSFVDVYGHQQAMQVMIQERDDALAQAVAGRIGEAMAHQAELLQTFAGAELASAAPAGEARLPATLEAAFPRGVALLDGRGEGVRAAAGGGDAWSGAAWVRPLAEAAQAGARPVYEAVTPTDLAVAVPLPGEAGALVGVLPMAGSGVARSIDGLLVSPQAQARLLDGQGTPIYEAGPAQAQGGAEVITARMPVAGTGWQVEVTEPWHSLVPFVLRYAQATVLIAAVAVLISLLSVYSSVRHVSGPLQALGQRARRVAWGDFDAVAEPVGGVEEIAGLQRALQQMTAQVRGYQAAMRSYVAAVTRAQEEERVRLARELHDETVQSLIALGQQMERVQRSCRPGSAAAAQVAELRQGVRGLVQDLRRLIGDLRPVCLDDLGLEPALEMLVGRLPAGLQAELVVEGAARRLAPELELAAYRIVQEALKNVAQHSRATHVRVQLSFEAQALRAVVEDDGVGFAVPGSPDDPAGDGHFGLLGMRERAMRFGGWLKLTSAPGEGTRVEAYIPTPVS